MPPHTANAGSEQTRALRRRIFRHDLLRPDPGPGSVVRGNGTGTQAQIREEGISLRREFQQGVVEILVLRKHHRAPCRRGCALDRNAAPVAVDSIGRLRVPGEGREALVGGTTSGAHVQSRVGPRGAVGQIVCIFGIGVLVDGICECGAGGGGAIDAVVFTESFEGFQDLGAIDAGNPKVVGERSSLRGGGRWHDGARRSQLR